MTSLLWKKMTGCGVLEVAADAAVEQFGPGDGSDEHGGDDGEPRYGFLSCSCRL